MESFALIGFCGLLAVVSYLISPRAHTVQAFFRGYSDAGEAPGVLTLILSQVTTWVFARSLMNAGILGYFYGISGALAYTAYYLSFVTGAYIVDGIRFRHGFDSVQDFLVSRFGRLGAGAYNCVAGIRLLSEVFANLLVIGIIFGVAGSTAYIVSILAVAAITLGYSMMGGLRASLRTDVMQMILLIVVLAILFGQTLLTDGFAFPAIVASSPDLSGPGWILLAVALLQIWSYPMHDPVMMDRGFVADRDTTRRSFLHAWWLSSICILVFGLLGVHAGLVKLDGETMVVTLMRIFGDTTMMLFNVALILSAVSTLDSTFSSAAKLSIVDMRLADPTPRNGRVAMALFFVGGLAFLFFGGRDLFAAVAVSGTASMFLAPVIFFCVWGGRQVARWAFAVAFVAAIGGAGLYMVESSGYLSVIEPLIGVSHKYAKLLVISASVMVIGCGAFALGLRREAKASV